MSHFFHDSSSSENIKTFETKKKKKVKNKKEKYTLDNLPVDEKQKINFISNYIKENKKIESNIAEDLLKIKGLPKNLKNVLQKFIIKKNEPVEIEEIQQEFYDLEIKDKEENKIENKISDCMEFGLKGVEMLDDLIKDYQNILVEKKPIKFKDLENHEQILKKYTFLEKLLKAKLSLFNQHINNISYLNFKNTLGDYLYISDILEKPTNKLFYIKMLMKTDYIKKDLIDFLSGIEEAKKIYFDFLFFSPVKPTIFEDSNKIRDALDKNGDSNESENLELEKTHEMKIEEEKLDDEFKLIYFLRTDYQKAVEYYSKNKNFKFNEKILKEFCIKSFQKNDLLLTNELISLIWNESNFMHMDENFENISITLEIVGIKPLEIIKNKFVILEKNTLLLKSLSKKMELMRAYFLKINYDYEGCADIIKNEMGVEISDFMVCEEIC